MENVLVNIENNICTITLNREKSMNSISIALLDELISAQ